MCGLKQFQHSLVFCYTFGPQSVTYFLRWSQVVRMFFICAWHLTLYRESVNDALTSLYLAEQVENGLDIYEISMMSEMNANC